MTYLKVLSVAVTVLACDLSIASGQTVLDPTIVDTWGAEVDTWGADLKKTMKRLEDYNQSLVEMSNALRSTQDNPLFDWEEFADQDSPAVQVYNAQIAQIEESRREFSQELENLRKQMDYQSQVIELKASSLAMELRLDNRIDDLDTNLDRFFNLFIGISVAAFLLILGLLAPNVVEAVRRKPH